VQVDTARPVYHGAQYLQNVTAATIKWYESSFKTFDGATDGVESAMKRIIELRDRASVQHQSTSPCAASWRFGAGGARTGRSPAKRGTEDPLNAYGGQHQTDNTLQARPA